MHLDEVSSWYSEALRTHGRSPGAVGWRNEKQHALRFQRLISVLDHPDRLGVVLDYGCGFGSFLSFLEDEQLNVDEYVGVDISRSQLAEAQRTVRNSSIPCTLLETSSPSLTCDYVFISGTFNLRMEIGEREWEEFVWETLSSLWEMTRCGLAVNFLSTHVDWQDESLFYVDPSSLIRRVLRELTPRLVVDHSYPLFEWSMGLQR